MRRSRFEQSTVGLKHVSAHRIYKCFNRFQRIKFYRRRVKTSDSFIPSYSSAGTTTSSLSSSSPNPQFSRENFVLRTSAPPLNWSQLHVAYPISTLVGILWSCFFGVQGHRTREDPSRVCQTRRALNFRAQRPLMNKAGNDYGFLKTFSEE